MVLNESAEKILRSNVNILFDQLEKAVNEYLCNGHSRGEFSFINAYLSATLNAVISYIERLIEAGRMQELDVVEALKFANNLQKHNPQLIRIFKPNGGFEFPFCIEEDGFEFLEISIVWDECAGLKTRKVSQKESYKKYLQQRKVIDTLKPIVECLLSGREAEINEHLFTL